VIYNIGDEAPETQMGHDSIQPFAIRGPASEVQARWKKWLRSFQYFVDAEAINDPDRLHSLLLHKAGPAVQEIFDDLPDPQATAPPEDDDAYKKTVRTLTHHFTCVVNPTFERHVFRKMTPESGETCVQFCTRIREQGKLCEFDDQLDDHLRDQIVATCQDAELQRELLSTVKLTLDVTLEKYRIHESSTLQARSMSSATTHATVDAVRSLPTPSRAESAANPAASRQGAPCTRCNLLGHANTSLSCPARNRRCNKCKKVGHYAVCCRSNSRTTGQRSTNLVNVLDEEDEAEPEPEYVGISNVSVNNTTGTPGTQPITAQVNLNGQPLTMEVDTGAHVSIIPLHIWRKSWQDVQIKPTKLQLSTFSEAPLTVIGEAHLDVAYEAQRFTAPIVIVKEGRTPLLGRNWLAQVQLNWSSICAVRSSADILDEFPGVFSAGLGKIHDHEAIIHIAPEAVPKCYSARPLPYAVKPKVDIELDRLIAEGVLVPVDAAEWATPIVAITKKDESIRLCGDFKVTLNAHIQSNIHPIPNPTDLLSNLSGATVFSKLDVSQAYNQLPLHADSQKLCVIATHRGLFAFTRLPFGVSSAPAIWQRTIEQILGGIEGVIVYFDDILISGRTQAEHDVRLRQVLARLDRAGLKLKRHKCELYDSKVNYLGFVVSEQGVHTDPAKVAAIVDAAEPADVSQLQSFLGLVNFYSRFIPNSSQLMFPLNQLLQKGVKWEWSEQCKKSFEDIKSVLSSSSVLAHYDPSKPLVLECDASPHGIGACLLQQDSQGNFRPVVYVSRSLAPAERNYSQIEREALAIVFAVKRLKQYLLGRHFTLRTDHKPLVKIFGEHSQLPAVTAARLQRWAVALSEYNYSIQHINGLDNVIADCLSRLPIKLSAQQERKIVKSIEASSMDPCHDIPLNASDVAKASKQDPTLSKVMHYLSTAWPTHIADELQPYYRMRNELSVESSCIVWGTRVIIPLVFRRLLLDELHSNHLGTSRMKAVARSFFWWPNLDTDIVNLSASCRVCQQQAHMPDKQPVHHWVYPTRPLERVHVDFAECRGNHYFLISDAYSKWADVFLMGKNTTTQRTISCLKRFIGCCGIPSTIVSDNGPQFVSSEFATFCAMYGIRHKRTPPYHPASNGQVERLVQELKKYINKSTPTSDMHRLSDVVSDFLFMYRNTPHSASRVTPASLIMKFTPTTRLTFLYPDFAGSMQEKQTEPVPVRKSFQPGDHVWIKNHRDRQTTWVSGTVLSRLGPLAYSVQCGSAVRHVHADHMRPNQSVDESSTIPATSQPDTLDVRPPIPSSSQNFSATANATPSVDNAPNENANVPPVPVPSVEQPSTDTTQMNTASTASTPVTRRSTRVSKKPHRLVADPNFGI